MWASRVNQGYISLTCHYLTQGFVIKAFTLAHTHLPEGHTTANIQSCFTTTIKKRALDLNAVHVCMCACVHGNGQWPEYSCSCTSNGVDTASVHGTSGTTSGRTTGHQRCQGSDPCCVFALQEGMSNSGALQAQHAGNTMAQEYPEVYGAAKYKSCPRCRYKVE